MIDADSFLQEFKQLPNWLLWRNEGRNGKRTKIPYSAHGGMGSSTDSATWSTYVEATALAANYDGLGFAITDGNVLIDLDDCRDPVTGTIDTWAQFIVDFLSCPAEISPSGTGLHIYVKDVNAHSLTRKFATAEKKKRGIEVYAGGRYSAITFQHLPGTPREIPEFDLTQFLDFVKRGQFDPEEVSTANDVQVAEVCTGWEQRKAFHSPLASTFDLARWLGTWSVEVLRQKPDGVYLITCVGTHGDYDKRDGHAFVKQLPSGALAMGCLHQSCSLSNGGGNRWKEFRHIVEASCFSPAPTSAEATRPRTDAGATPTPPPASAGTVRETVEPVSIGRVDMPETVLDGRLGEICQRYFKRFPVAYAWPALVTAAGALIPRGENYQIRNNLYACLVGPKGSSKSETCENVFRVLGMWPKHPVLLKAKYGSAEGLIDRLGEIEAGGERLVYPDELGHLLAKAAMDRASFPYVLNTAYSNDQQEGGTKGKGFQFDCRLSLLGGIVEELFGDSFGLATTGGLYDRFTFGLCPDPYQHLYEPPESTAETFKPFAASVDRDVWEASRQWVKNGINPRVAEHALRVAYICASVDGRMTLRSADLAPALAFAQYQTKVRTVLQPNDGGNPDAICANQILGWLTQNAPHGTWVKRRDLDRGIHSSRLGPGVFIRCLNNLFFNGKIELLAGEKSLRLIPFEER